MSTKIYDKRNAFDFDIVNFSFFHDDVPLMVFIYEPHCEKTGLRGVRPGLIELLEIVDTMLDVWYSFLNDVIDKHAPIKTHRIKNEVQPEWVTSDILD